MKALSLCTEGHQLYPLVSAINLHSSCFEFPRIETSFDCIIIVLDRGLVSVPSIWIQILADSCESKVPIRKIIVSGEAFSCVYGVLCGALSHYNQVLIWQESNGPLNHCDLDPFVQRSYRVHLLPVFFDFVEDERYISDNLITYINASRKLIKSLK